MTDSVVVLSALAVILWAVAVGFVCGQWFERDSDEGWRKADYTGGGRRWHLD